MEIFFQTFIVLASISTILGYVLVTGLSLFANMGAKSYVFGLLGALWGFCVGLAGSLIWAAILTIITLLAQIAAA